jgi:hypothetical protein
MTYLENTISQPSMETSLILLPIIKEEIKRIQENGSLNLTHGEVNKLQFSSQTLFCINKFSSPLHPFLIVSVSYLKYF